MATDAENHFGKPEGPHDTESNVSCITKASGLCSKHGKPALVGADGGNVYQPFPGASTTQTTTHPKPRDACVKASDTAEIAFFLKHTGPPSNKKTTEVSLIKPARRIQRSSTLTMLKRRRVFGNKTHSSASSLADASGGRLYNLDRRTLSNGRTYIHITPTAETARRLLGKPSTKSLRSPQRAPRISNASTDRTTVADPNALDEWLQRATWTRERPEPALTPILPNQHEIARASSRLLGYGDRLVSLEDFSKPETSWGQDILSQHLPASQSQGLDAKTKHYKEAIEPEEGIRQREVEARQYLPSLRHVIDAEPGGFRIIAPALGGEQDSADKSDNEPWPALSRNATNRTRHLDRDGDTCRSSGSGRDSVESCDRKTSTRLKKLKDLRYARRRRDESPGLLYNQDAGEGAGWKTPESLEEDLKGFHSGPSAGFAPSQDQPNPMPSLEPSPDMLTSGTTRSTGSSLSPVMLIAEQFPLPRTKHARRPSPLLLPAQQASEQLAIAVREDAVGSRKKLSEERKKTVDAYSRSKAEDDNTKTQIQSTQQVGNSLTARSGSDKKLSTSSGARSTSGAANRHRSASFDADTGFPSTISGSDALKQKSMTSSQSSLSGLNEPMINAPIRPPHGLLAQTMPTKLQRSSVATPPPASTEARLEAQVELLQREVKLLEAALMAVLKTGGQLNGCPCQEVKLESESQCRKDGGLTGGQSDTNVARRLGGGGANKSPLSLYLETRAHGVPLERYDGLKSDVTK